MMPQKTARYVFVYGTLRRGARNDITRLQPAPRFVGMAVVAGTLYRIGWYPGLVLGGEAPLPVVGEVYEITPALEATLDGIEAIEPGPDSEYFKRELCLEVDGAVLPCLIYELNPARVKGLHPLACGDWMSFHFARS